MYFIRFNRENEVVSVRDIRQMLKFVPEKLENRDIPGQET